jgi:hypothetical protein
MLVVNMKKTSNFYLIITMVLGAFSWRSAPKSQINTYDCSDYGSYISAFIRVQVMHLYCLIIILKIQLN